MAEFVQSLATGYQINSWSKMDRAAQHYTFPLRTKYFKKILQSATLEKNGKVTEVCHKWRHW